MICQHEEYTCTCRLHTSTFTVHVLCIHTTICTCTQNADSVEKLSRLMDILTYFHSTCPAAHIPYTLYTVLFQFTKNSLDLLDTISSMTGCFHTTDTHPHVHGL